MDGKQDEADGATVSTSGSATGEAATAQAIPNTGSWPHSYNLTHWSVLHKRNKPKVPYVFDLKQLCLTQIKQLHVTLKRPRLVQRSRQRFKAWFFVPIYDWLIKLHQMLWPFLQDFFFRTEFFLFFFWFLEVLIVLAIF